MSITPTSRIVIIYDYFTPAFRAGGPTQSLANMTQSLSLDLHIIASCKDLDGTILDVPTNRWLPIPAADGATQPAHQAWYCADRQYDIRPLIQGDDTLFINSIFSHHFDYPALICSHAKRKIISPRGMLDPGSLSQKKWKKQLYLTWWKLRGLDKMVEWHATTDMEKENIHRVFGSKAKVWVAANFPRVVDRQHANKQVGELRMISVAVISPMKNHLLVLEALKSVKEKVFWDIYGPVKDPNYWTECQLIMQQLPAHISVVHHGDVPPPEVPNVLQKAHIAMLPSKSENFGHAIFEAFTAGKPVVTSHNTPWNGLTEKEAGANVSINNYAEIATVISRFAQMSQEEYDRWSSAARSYALSSIDLDSIASSYLRMFANNEQ